jgi:addiction module HigA family antidote
MSKRLLPMHPGEVLREEFLVPLKLSAGALARKMDVLVVRIQEMASTRAAATGVEHH